MGMLLFNFLPRRKQLLVKEKAASSIRYSLSYKLTIFMVSKSAPLRKQ